METLQVKILEKFTSNFEKYLDFFGLSGALVSKKGKKRVLYSFENLRSYEVDVIYNFDAFI